MWYISFQGETDGGENNIHVYHNSGEKHKHSKLLPEGGANPKLLELRGFAIQNQLLYVVNANKGLSQILVYEAKQQGGYSFKEIFASRDTVNSILHPYDLTFDAGGNCYISSQDTNVVTGLSGKDAPLAVASYLLEQYPPPQNQFLSGTIVASSKGALPHVAQPSPPDVPAPQGLTVSFTDDTQAKVANSVRGLFFHEGYLYVADEPADAVKVYEAKTGRLNGMIAGNNLGAPVQLLLNEQTNSLYIGSTANASVFRYDLSHGAPTETVTPELFIDAKVKHISGIAFDAAGNFYAAERKKKRILKFDGDGSHASTFIDNLPDDPEFILYVPKDDI